MSSDSFSKKEQKLSEEIARIRTMSAAKKTINDTKSEDIRNITLSDEQNAIFELLENSNDHFFITGKAGTGKSMLLQYFKQKSKKSMVVGAFTGVAALNIGAQTLNSLFRLPFGRIDSDVLSIDSKTKSILEHVDTVVIDEISMVRVDMMDAIDTMLRLARDVSLPFGGVQIIMFGDLYQLPPIIADRDLNEYFNENNGGSWFFNAHVWKETTFRTIELSNIFRQKDPEFRRFLNTIREGGSDEKVLSFVNSRFITETPATGVITIATTNKIIDEINGSRLKELNTKMHEYHAEITGQMETSYFPTDERLKLKEGAQVMLLKNDKEKRWVNGTIGVVTSLSAREIKVNIEGKTFNVPKEIWQKIRYTFNEETKNVDEEVISSFTQFPLRLAWASTIHKSQGKTYESMVLDMGNGAFAHGQTYVALSRCTTLEGIYLKKPLRQRDIIVDTAIAKFMKEAEIEVIKLD